VLVIRSVVFNVLFYLNLLVHFIAAIPTLAMPRWGIIAVARFWARTNLWLLRTICGIRVEFRGVEKIPPGPLLVSSKHQSLWETFALLLILPDPAYIMKRELMWIPFFGWYTWKAGMIPVDRSRGSQALAEMNACARREAQRNRQIIIFPRHAPPSGAEPKYKYGVVSMPRWAFRACRSRSIPGCSGRADRSAAIPARSGRGARSDPPGLGKDEFFERLQDEVKPRPRLVAVGERESAGAERRTSRCAVILRHQPGRRRCVDHCFVRSAPLRQRCSSVSRKPSSSSAITVAITQSRLAPDWHGLGARDATAAPATGGRHIGRGHGRS
jgi:1-acyl-sn-glycerol-3-phosphate acyltransferase